MSKRKIILTIIFLILLSLIGYFSYKIYNTYHDNKKTEKEITNIKKEVINKEEKEDPVAEEPTEQQDTPKGTELSLDFSKLKKINSDTVGWIKISNTNIDYPIVKGNDNKYYLNHSFYKVENMNGWIFESYLNSSSFDDDNTVIFGHNTNGYTMFSELKDIYKGTLGTNIDVTIYLENETFSYKVFSVYLEDPSNTTNISKFTNDDIVDMMKSKSKLNIEAEVDENSKILTLSTCNNTTNDRIIVHAVKIN